MFEPGDAERLQVREAGAKLAQRLQLRFVRKIRLAGWKEAPDLFVTSQPADRMSSAGDRSSPQTYVADGVESDAAVLFCRTTNVLTTLTLIGGTFARAIDPTTQCAACDCPRGDLLIVVAADADSSDALHEHGFADLANGQ